MAPSSGDGGALGSELGCRTRWGARRRSKRKRARQGWSKSAPSAPATTRVPTASAGGVHTRPLAQPTCSSREGSWASKTLTRGSAGRSRLVSKNSSSASNMEKADGLVGAAAKRRGAKVEERSTNAN